VLKVNSTLTFDFVTRTKFLPSHYAFKVTEEQFDVIFQKVKDAQLSFGSSPSSQEDGEINHNGGGRGVYFKDINGHVLEILTQDYNIN